MNCETCNVKSFVHPDLYCSTCPDKPKPKTITGTAYLHRLNSFKPVCSVEVEAPAGMEYEVSAAELLRDHRIEFIEDSGINQKEIGC